MRGNSFILQLVSCLPESVNFGEDWLRKSHHVILVPRRVRHNCKLHVRDRDVLFLVCVVTRIIIIAHGDAADVLPGSVRQHQLALAHRPAMPLLFL